MYVLGVVAGMLAIAIIGSSLLALFLKWKG